MKKNLSEIQLAWAAGIIDGEGTVSFTVRKPKDVQKSKRIQPIVEVEITNKEIVFLFQKWFGGFIWYRKKRKEKWAGIWLWRVTSRKALVCLQLVFPYLRIKKSQAEIIFEFYNLGIYCGAKDFAKSKIMMKRERLLDLIRFLNLKGEKSVANFNWQPDLQ